jgi:hypothetical protein
MDGPQAVPYQWIVEKKLQSHPEQSAGIPGIETGSFD